MNRSILIPRRNPSWLVNLCKRVAEYKRLRRHGMSIRSTIMCLIHCKLK